MFIAGTGMACPVGLNAVTACAAKRAGISALENLPYNDNTGEPIVGGIVPGLDWTLATVVSPNQVAKQGASRSSKRATGCALGPGAALGVSCRAGRPGGAAELGPIDRAAGGGRIGCSVSSEKLARVLFRPYRGVRSVGEARYLIQHERVPVCVVCGIDSFINAATLTGRTSIIA